MTTFGEIVEPVSRASWEDWDDIRYSYISDLKWKQELQIPEKIETLLIFEGKYLTDCINMQTETKLELINTIPEANLQLFKTRMSNRYMCTIKDYNVVLSSEIVELLKEYLNVSSDVIAIQTKSLQEYLVTEVSSQDCIIRTVNTTVKHSSSLDLNFPRLEQPNFISGVSAGVISVREHLDQPATVVVCYMEHPEEYQTVELEKLLEKLQVSQNKKSRPSTVLNSNIYI